MQEVIGSIPFRSIVLNKYPLAKAGGYLFSSAFFLFFIFLKLRIVPPCGRGSLLYLVLKKIKNRAVCFYTPKKSSQNFCVGFCVYSALFVARICGVATRSRYASLLTPSLNTKSLQNGFFRLKNPRKTFASAFAFIVRCSSLAYAGLPPVY